MDFLLWIALIGVIVFLLGLTFSKFSKIAGKKPAINTIPPAASPPPPAAAPTKTATPGVAVKTVPTIHPAEPVGTPAATQTPSPDSQPVVIKPVPAAEPVGPAFQPTNVAPVKDTTKAQTDVASSEAKMAEETVSAPPATPKLLKKPRNNGADDLTKISGIGKAIQDKLFKAGIFHYEQLTDLNSEQTAWINKTIGFAGRAERENWSAQAEKLLRKTNTATKPTVKTPAKRTTKSVKAKTPVKAKAKPAKKSATTE